MTRSESVFFADDPEADRLSGCVGKEGFADKTLAMKIASRRRKTNVKLLVYRCRFCDLFHLGADSRKKKK